MGKAYNCLKMLEILSTGSIYKISELAALIDTNPRNITEYKIELETMGYYIDSIPGRYGGLKLSSQNTLPSINFTENEKDALRESFSHIVSRKNFLKQKDYKTAMGKVMSNFDNSLNDVFPLDILEKNTINFDSKELEVTYKVINESIKQSKLCSIEITNNKGNITSKTIKPYELYLYNENWFVLGECIETDNFKCYKLSRIKKIVKLDKKFSRDPYFRKSDYIDEAGFKRNDEWYEIKLEIKGYFLTKIREMSIGKNQSLKMIDKNTGILTVRMQYKFNIISFVMGMGSLCKVIEPLWLKEQVIKISKEMLGLYTNE